MEKNKVTAYCKVLIIGGSAGSLSALMEILPHLPAIHSFAIVIVLHRKNSDNVTLEELLKVKSKTSLKIIEDKMSIEAGFLYVVPSNYHLLFEKNGTIALDSSEKVNYSRPSIDVSFEAAAEIYRSNVIGILLSGSNTDGTAGLQAIQKAGGTTVVHNPTSADMPFMPSNAIQNMTPDYILTTDEILKFILLING
ncbi:two-component system chemotaxis response regulator CheB [Flavobacterium sp. PL11]|jgi:two-component system chemotaxis response regulator CheB|uniref:chemotaxis protein CheB n=1 Tax=Flavobacterium sp. PL11 TaxID=3071717 RepID=UPI002E0746D2|nr:two-component system chemotaxis response regulator CheB [Flavobacterium sp. PL11]